MSSFEKIFAKAWPDLLVLCAFLLVSTLYFLSPLSEGLVLGGHDSVAAVGLGQEQKEYRASHDGETTRWNRSEFVGVIRDECIAEWAAEKLAQLRQEQTEMTQEMTM